MKTVELSITCFATIPDAVEASLAAAVATIQALAVPTSGINVSYTANAAAQPDE